MDCGPASLKCLLEGFHMPISYGRLREACQTDVDGTSIDTIEVVANDLGLRADQVMIPVEHVFLEDAANLPALVVVRHSDGPTHFVVVWRRVGAWLQILDPAIGRRWVACERFGDEIVRHEMSIPAQQWRAWAATEDFLVPLRKRLARLGADRVERSALIDEARGDAGWFGFGALDASARLVQPVMEAKGVARGPEALRLLRALIQQTRDSSDSIFTIIPPSYWSVSPDPGNTDWNEQRLLLRGAVLMRVAWRPRSAVDERTDEAEESRPLSPELKAALAEEPPSPLRAVWGLLRADGLAGLLALVGALGMAVAAMAVEALLFRGLFDIGTLLKLGSQRLLALLGLVTFMALSLAFQMPIVSESLRFGRHLDARLRMALLRKLPRLTDRYFQSRPISDMADRSHSIQLLRLLPGMGIHFVQALCDLVLTLAGIILIDPGSALLALTIVSLAVAVPAAFQPMIGERDLRVRNHAGSLSRFYLDALLGLVPIRAHRAQAAVRRQHESLLVEWTRSSRRFIRASVVAGGIQSVCCTALAGVLLVQHFLRSGGVTGADLLLVFWTLKLPAIGQTLTGLAHQYPMQRNVLLRLLEPLSAPEHGVAHTPAVSGTNRLAHRDAGESWPAPRGGRSARGVSIEIEQGSVVAAGHTILRDLALSVAPGEHVAIVGLSGAGKSSLLGLLLGWHRLARGRLQVDGRDLTDDRLLELRRQTAWVDPAVQIWNTSFLENVNYSSVEGNLPRSAAAIDAAHLRSVLQKLPNGLQTALGEGGALLSGGEGQRVRLARALAQPDVRLALLDEPFRGMDRTERSALLTDVRAHWRDATLFCVTHDVDATLGFDRVLVVEGGIVVEDGCPSRLAERRSRYRELLEAEQRVRDRMWKAETWRHVRVDDGQVTSLPARWLEHSLTSGRKH
jgi:ATP-binding cassette subfamily B protein